MANTEQSKRNWEQWEVRNFYHLQTFVTEREKERVSMSKPSWYIFNCGIFQDLRKACDE